MKVSKLDRKPKTRSQSKKQGQGKRKQSLTPKRRKQVNESDYVDSDNQLHEMN